MKKVAAVNVECRAGMISTEFAFIEAGRQAGAQSVEKSVAQSAKPAFSATTSDNLQSMPAAEGFFADRVGVNAATIAVAR